MCPECGYEESVNEMVFSSGAAHHSDTSSEDSESDHDVMAEEAWTLQQELNESSLSPHRILRETRAEKRSEANTVTVGGGEDVYAAETALTTVLGDSPRELSSTIPDYLS